jgi:hypothetical protein
MNVWVYESNLIWSSRLLKTLAALGHDSALGDPGQDPPEGPGVAIVNLGDSAYRAEELVPRLRASGKYVVGHAGHKERGLLAQGVEAGCDRIASNSELTFRLDRLLEEATRQSCRE